MARRATSNEGGGDAWFIQDMPVDSKDADAFSHVDVADNLRAMIASVPDRLTIGLTGSFGVGKSTVIGLLADSLRGSRTEAVVRLSAERHTATGLQRSLIYAFAEALVEQAKVDRLKVQPILAELEVSSARTMVEPGENAITRWWRQAHKGVRLGAILGGMVLAAGLLVSGGIWAILGSSVQALVPSWLSLSLSTGLLATVLLGGYRVFGVDDWIKAAAKPDTKTTTKPRLEAADEFERVFAQLAGLVDLRLVVAVDDIDRLAPNLVLDALNTIRSFQQSCEGRQPVFIVSCDEVIVRRAIATAEPGLAETGPDHKPAAEAFLDRLFTQRQVMPPHPQVDMLSFARRVTDPGRHEGARRLGDALDEVLSVLVHDAVADPRHVIRLLNVFFADYRLALKREASTGNQGVGRGEITGYPTVLARLTVLAVDFPLFYQELRQDEDLLALLTRWVRAEEIETPDERRLAPFFPKGTFGNLDTGGELASPGIEKFIGRTASVPVVPSLQPFLYRGQDQLTRALGTRFAMDVRGALVNGQVAVLRDEVAGLTASAGDATAPSEQLDAFLGIVTLVLGGVDGLELTNAITTAATLHGHLLGPRLSNLAEAITAALARSPRTELPPEAAAVLADAARKPQSVERLMSQLLADKDDPDKARDRDLTVLRHRANLERLATPGRILGLLDNAAQRLGTGGLDTASAWVEAVLEHAIPEDPVVPWVAAGTLQAAAFDNGQIHEEWADQVLALLAAARAATDDRIESAAVNLAAEAPRTRAVCLGVRAMATLSSPRAESIGRLLENAAEGVFGEDGRPDADFDLDTSIVYIQLVGKYITHEEPSTKEKEQVLAKVAPMLTGFVAEAAEENGAPDLVDPLLEVFALAVRERLAIRDALARAMSLAWEGMRDQPSAAAGYATALITCLDELTERDAIAQSLVSALHSRPESDPALTNTLPMIPQLLGTASGRGGVAGVINMLNQQLGTDAGPLATAAVTVLRLIHRDTPEPLEQNSTVSALVTLVQRGVPFMPIGLDGFARIPWQSDKLATVLSQLTAVAGHLTPQHAAALLDQFAALSADQQFEMTIPAPVSGVLIGQAELAPEAQRCALFVVSAPEQRSAMVTRVPDIASVQTEVLQRMDEPERDVVLSDWIRECVRVLDSSSIADAERACRQTLRTTASWQTAYGACVRDLFRDQVENGLELKASVWVVLVDGLAEGDRLGLVRHLLEVLDGDQAEVLRSLPALEALATVDDRMLPVGQLASILVKWVREIQDLTTSELFATALSASPALSAVAKKALGKRPGPGQAREVWNAAYRAVTQTARKAG